MNISFRQLQAFVLGAECKAFSAAALRMGISQPGYSLQMRQMEEALGFRLFNRSTRKVELTPAGAEWLPSAQRSLQQMLEARRHADDVRLARRGLLRLCVVPSAAYGLLPTLMHAFRQAHPAVRLELREEPATGLVELVREGQVDLGLGPLLEPALDLVAEPLMRDDLVLLTPKAHPLANLANVPWDVLPRHDYIAVASHAGARIQADQAAAMAGVTLKPLHEVSSLTTLLGMILACSGYTVLPRLLVAGLNQGGLVVCELDKPRVWRTLSLLYRRAVTLSPVADAFAQAARRHFPPIPEPAP